MVIRIRAGLPVFYALAASALVGACGLSAPDHFTESRVQVQQDRLSGALPVSQFDEAKVAEVATHVAKSGEGPVELTVTYDPYSRKATAMDARNEARRIAALLRKNGVEDIKADILPVVDSGDEMNAMFSYTYYSALPPADCEMLPGVTSRTINAEADHKLGCTVDTLFARQVARPKDLAGQGVEADNVTDGRRASNIVDRYRAGVPNEPLDGETASDQ